MYRYIPIFIISFVLIFQGYIFFQDKNNSIPKEISLMVLGNKEFQTEVLSDDISRAKGLSGRKSLCSYCSVLFIFKNEGKYRFWMKEMNFPIDIIWLDKDQKIIYRRENVKPETFPETFGPLEEDSLYVIEVNEGTYKDLGLYIGQKVLFK